MQYFVLLVLVFVVYRYELQQLVSVVYRHELQRFDNSNTTIKFYSTSTNTILVLPEQKNWPSPGINPGIFGLKCRPTVRSAILTRIQEHHINGKLYHDWVNNLTVLESWLFCLHIFSRSLCRIFGRRKRLSQLRWKRASSKSKRLSMNTTGYLFRKTVILKFRND